MSMFSFSSEKKAGGKRGMKQKISMFLFKAKTKRMKRNGKKQRAQAKNEATKAFADTLPEKEPITYDLGQSKGICRELKLIFSEKSKDTDTISVYFPDRNKNISDEKKRELKEYVEKIGADSITQIFIKNCHSKSILTEHEIIWLEERARKIARYLKTLNLPKSKIKTEE